MRDVLPQHKNISPVIPAQAGIHSAVSLATGLWIPACAGMTGLGLGGNAT